MELYHRPMSHNARKARALARHLNLDVGERVLSMQDNEHKTQEFLAINPMGQVPAIRDGGYAVWQANAVLIFLTAQSEIALFGAIGTGMGPDHAVDVLAIDPVVPGRRAASCRELLQACSRHRSRRRETRQRHGAVADFRLDAFPNVARWLATNEALPVWTDTAPPKIG